MMPCFATALHIGASVFFQKASTMGELIVAQKGNDIMKRALPLITVLLLTLPTLWATEPRPITPAPFATGDRWGVLGDSITRSGQYHRYVELFYLTRFPSLKLDVINCGISGDTAPGALQRLQWDCLEAKPNVVSVMLGMNDVTLSLYAPGGDTGRRAKTAETYDTAMRQLTKSLLDSGVKVVLITPSIFDDTAELPSNNYPGAGAALGEFANRVRAIADEFQVPLIDFNGPMTAINAEQQKSNPRFTIVGGDRIHPTPPGHFVMAYEFLRAQGLAGVVSRITIDAATGQADVLENCTVTNLKVRDGEVVFTCLENALPFPVEAPAKPALDLIPFSQEFNQQILTVRGLAPGDYALSIDGKEIRKFTAAELNDGVNLASELNTPQAQQSLAVLAELQKKWDLVAKLRNLAVCEHTSWPNAPRPINPEQMSIKLDARLERAKNNPAIFEAHKQYLEFKPLEADLLREAEVAANNARLAAQIKPHAFALHRLPVATAKPSP
jgi:lysophospholipase L1-like esterase